MKVNPYTKFNNILFNSCGFYIDFYIYYANNPQSNFYISDLK